MSSEPKAVPWPMENPRRISREGREYRKRLREVEETYRPTIVDCKACGSPRNEKYRCIYCGNE